jgi:heme/copper-type cytochrome/quinol oxidase subunit 4
MVMVLFRRRITVIMALLLMATLISFWLGNDGAVANSRTAAVIIVIAAVKMRFVMRDFMEIKYAPLLLKFFCDAWIATVAAAILILQWQVARVVS